MEHIEAGSGSLELQPLLTAVDAEIVRRPADLAALRSAMERLYEYLASPEGRTEANVRAADLYFANGIFEEGYWGHLPQAFQAILWDTGGQLHDTISAPALAQNFESLPEQLLERTRALDV